MAASKTVCGVGVGVISTKFDRVGVGVRVEVGVLVGIGVTVGIGVAVTALVGSGVGVPVVWASAVARIARACAVAVFSGVEVGITTK